MMRIDGLLRCIFRVLRVSSFNGLYSAPRPFLLTLTTVNVDIAVWSSSLYTQRQQYMHVFSLHAVQTATWSQLCHVDGSSPASMQ